MQPIGRRGAVTFVNDSKATNADAASQALSSYDRIYWIAGGLPKEGGIASLKPLYNRIAKAYLIGEAAPAFAATLGTDVVYEISGTLENAVRHAASDAEKDDVPGAVVKNFEVRGDAFVALVAGLDGISMLV
jgi:UDP-N-acetylmuramoylalanine--D-glutamate ligase